jgi:hypothetical protein
MPLLLIWAVRADRTAPIACRRGRRGRLAGGAKDGLPVTESHGKITKIKRRTQGLYLGAQNGERSGRERDRWRGAAVAVVLRGGGAVERGRRMWERGRVKGQPQGSLGRLYRARKARGATARVMAINGHGRRSSKHSKGGVLMEAKR